VEVAVDTVVHLEVHGTSLGSWLLEPEDLSRTWRLSLRMVALMNAQLMR